MEHLNIKRGDTVISMANPFEDTWSKYDNINFGNKLKVKAVAFTIDHKKITSIFFEGKQYWHPAELFKVYKRPKSSKPVRSKFEQALITFLKEHNCLIEFCVNCAFDSSNYTFSEAINNFNKSPNFIFIASFYWARTSEGHEYWEELSDTWRKTESWI
jgi:hypothetical protein